MTDREAKIKAACAASKRAKEALRYRQSINLAHIRGGRVYGAAGGFPYPARTQAELRRDEGRARLTIKT
jgi:hypothetical protein